MTNVAERADDRPAAAAAGHDDAIVFERVTFSYGGAGAVLDGVDLRVPRGVLFALIGPNGAGKSTSLNLITTLLSPGGGHVRVCGHDTVAAPAAVRRVLGYAPEESLLFSGLTAREFVTLSATLHGVGAEAAAAATTRLIGDFGLGERADDMLASFSKGMRRKAVLAAALVHDPELLVLDEPMEGLDVVAQQTLKELLRQRVARGRSVLYSTHIIEIVESLCSHVAVLRQGRVLAAGPIGEARAALGVARLEDVFHAPAAGA
ncbi:MAG TPA: ABC transporter ATP-binding protein [Polyangia bacterium]|nr:ABC transporter ATP-binding protein [Polyangia bacterium]